MPADLTILLYVATSSPISLLNSSGVEDFSTTPCTRMRSLNSGTLTMRRLVTI